MTPGNMTRQWIAATALALAMAGLTQPAQAQSSVVILSQQCDYVLLDAGGEQVLVKLIDGQPPETGDTLTGPLKAKDFTSLMNSRNKQAMNVWVDMIDGNNRPLSRYTQYCS